ncbi:MAG: amidohydrolase family protein [Planctomycetales bacterium]|nr:amidohydrolase family protein [Planctomycetales bacterium]
MQLVSANRRHFLVHSLATSFGTIAATQTCSCPASSDARTGSFIDSHVHVWTDDVGQYPLARDYRVEDMRPARFTPQDLLTHASPCGVSRIVLIQMSYYGFDNAYMLACIQKHPDTFVGVAVIDPEQAHVADTMRQMKKQRVHGFRLHLPPGTPAQYERWLGRTGVQTMWRIGAETRQAMCLLINANALPVVDGLCQQYPETPVVIDHMARIGIDGSIQSTDVENLLRLARHRQTFVKVSAFYALGKKRSPYTDLAGLIRQLRDAYGAERLMWASDCPFQVVDGHNYRDSIDLISRRLDFLTSSDQEYLLGKTAQSVYF